MARLVIEPIGLHWLYDAEPTDLCAHGGIRVTLDGELIFEAGAGNDGYTLSTSALHLLRTVSRDYDAATTASSQLIPCCGNNMVFDDISGEVVNLPCPNGIEWSVRHSGAGVSVRLSDTLGLTLSSEEWRRAVHAFSARVRDFYFAEPPRLVDNEDDAAWHQHFVSEWNTRHEAAA